MFAPGRLNRASEKRWFAEDDSAHLADRITLVHISLLKSKIHRATVTGAEVNYEGSITISADLADEAGLEEYERVSAGNMTNGERFETYVIYGARGRGLIELNGATAHLGKPGDILTIMSFGWYDVEEAASHQPNVVLLGANNQVIRQSATV
jgi:aspartate 1-decarboxylase